MDVVDGHDVVEGLGVVIVGVTEPKLSGLKQTSPSEKQEQWRVRTGLESKWDIYDCILNSIL